MKISVETKEPQTAAADLLVVLVPELPARRWRFPGKVAALDRALDGRLASAVASGDFRGRSGQTHVVYPEGQVSAKRVLMLGIGEEAKLDTEALRKAGGHAASNARIRSARKLAVLQPASKRIRVGAAAQAIVEGIVLSDYRFHSYRSKRKDDRPELASATLVLERSGDRSAATEGAKAGEIIATSQNLARDLSNEPPNELPPEALARAAQRMSKECSVRCKVFGVAELRKRKMGGILAVGGGSAHTPRLIVMEYAPRTSARGAKKTARSKSAHTICLVGKGITFDSGGISIKPSAAMDEMKHDMSGAAAVVGAVRAAALLELPIRVVGVVAAAENLPSHTAYRPGDVVRTSSGKTIEVLNTDAEGRIVLSDALHFAKTEYEPAAIVDLATLTGACVVALGSWASGVMANNDRLATRLVKAGEATGEKVWQLPLWEDHRRAIQSEIADIKNTGGREGGTLTAAAFLSHFTEGSPWAHLDIAATAWTKKPGPYQDAGATGVGVRLLVELMQSWRRPI